LEADLFFLLFICKYDVGNVYIPFSKYDTLLAPNTEHGKFQIAVSKAARPQSPIKSHFAEPYLKISRWHMIRVILI